MHAGFHRRDPEESPQPFLQLFDQCLLASLVQGAHSTNMAEKVAFAHEVRRDGLEQCGRAAIHDRPQGAEGLDQGVRQYHVTQS
ncbi:hypothetical protein D3C78_1526730 [compost metagenome]